MRKSRFKFAVAGLAALSLITAACGGSDSSTDTTAAAQEGCTELTPVKLQLQWFIQAQFAGYFAAQDQGFYEAQCLDVQIVEGGVDIVIGTHALLGKGVEFKDLGLLIIDEEQRFGVMHKEKFKLMRTHVDVLTLSATPIPRTLYLALTGARDMSTIATPPQDRLPVETIVEHYDERVIREVRRLREVWHSEPEWQNVSTVTEHVHRLRRQIELDPGSPTHLITVRGSGYRFDP